MQTLGDKSLSVSVRRNEAPCSRPKNRKFLWWEKNKRGALEALPNGNECDRSRSLL